MIRGRDEKIEMQKRRRLHLVHTYGNKYIWLEFRRNPVGDCSDDVVNIIVCRLNVYWLSHRVRCKSRRQGSNVQVGYRSSINI